MKKFFVGLLSIFLILGGSILWACGSETPVLKLSEDSISIQLVPEDSDSGFKIITAEVSGASDPSIIASAISGYENIISISQGNQVDGKTPITVKGITEGYAEFMVRAKQGNSYKIVTVDVYSEVSSMKQKDENGKKNNFAIRGDSVTLIEDNLLEFYPSQKSRRTITWSLATGIQNASIEGNVLYINEDYEGDTILLIPTTEKGVTTEEPIVLPVINKIGEKLELSWSYSEATGFNEINEEYNTFLITPSYYPGVREYEGYIQIDYDEELDITPHVTTMSGASTNDIRVVRQGDYIDKPLFKVFADKDKSNLNNNYLVYFDIGYTDYNYNISTLKTKPITIEAREKVNGLTLSSQKTPNVDGTRQTLYTSYAENKGQEFNVSIIPTTVIGATRQYFIDVNITLPPITPISTDCPVEFWFKDSQNAGMWTQIEMELAEDENHNKYYTTKKSNLPSYTTIYIKATDNLLVQSFDGIQIKFTSVDNEFISTTFNATLVKSVTEKDFVFDSDEARFRIDSSSIEGDLTYRKRFTLTGQTEVDGLHTVCESEYLIMSDPEKISSDENSVTFEVVLKLDPSCYGITSLEKYKIVHDNGLTSDEFDIDIYLPLKEAGVRYDYSNNLNTVVNPTYTNLMYNQNGEVVSTTMDSLSSLMVKNNTNTPLLYRYNTSNRQNAVAKVSVNFYDFNSEELSLEEFKALRNTSVGLLELIYNGSANSDIVSFTNENSLIYAKNVGFTYAILTFTGKGSGENVDEEGNVTFVRIILIESFVAPDGLNVYPTSDNQITLFANDTVATIDEKETVKRVTINFNNSDVTYANLNNVEFVSTKLIDGRPAMGNQNQSGNSITWERGRYSINNILVSPSSIAFDVTAITTYNDYAYSEDLSIYYILRDDNANEILRIHTTINITIKNAQRIEKLEWRNSSEDGIYFKVGSNEPFYMLLSSAPSNARNLNISHIVTDEFGSYTTSFVTVTDDYSQDTLQVNLPQSITSGMKGYIYLLPEDAIYNNQIKYYYMAGESEKEEYVSVQRLGEMKDSTSRITWYDFLTSQAYFKSNANSTNESKNISFKDIIIRTKVDVADGKTFENAYRIYNLDDFNKIEKESYYTLMNSLDVSETSLYIDNFEGGLQGYNDSTTLKINKNFANTLIEGATIRNITFIGSVEGSGFVVNTNNGNIVNVTVDIDEQNPSVLNALLNSNAGGIAGVNNGVINSAKVLGLSIKSENATVGGIAGVNNGQILNSKVEFYKLRNPQTSVVEVNTFTGKIVGGIVGELRGEGLISHSYAYTYIDENVLSGEVVGAIAGNIENGKPTIDYSFAYVGDISSPLGVENERANLSNWYVKYKIGGSEEYSYNYVDGYLSNINFVINGQEGFLNYVNNGNHHLKGLYQDETTTISSDMTIKTFKDNNDYYKSIEVDSVKGLMFVYALERQSAVLSSREQNDLDALNRITLSQLLGVEENNNIIITSSDQSIIRVVGNTINVLKTGEVTLTISSKQNVELSVSRLVRVENAISNIEISYSDKRSNYLVQDDSITYLQKTKYRDYILSYSKPTVILGNMAREEILSQNTREIITQEIITIENPTADMQAVSMHKIANNQFKAEASKNSVDTKVIFKFEENDDFGASLNKEFERHFTISPTEGVIEFYLSEGNLPITPSINASVKVQIETTAVGDNLFPIISYGNEELSIRHEENSNIYKYYLLKDGEEKTIITVQTSLISQSKDIATGVYTYIFDVNFSVSEEYKSEISEDMNFNVYFVSSSGNTSEDTKGGNFNLVISRQNFTNIDITNMKVEYSMLEKLDDSYITVYTTGSPTGILAPGNGAVLKINVNPSFAYYDYMEIYYDGANVSNAVTMGRIVSYGESGNQFVADNSNTTMVDRALRYTPSSQDKETGVIYFNIWINTTVDKDTLLTFTARFCEKDGHIISYVSQNLLVSYLKEPVVSVDGEQTAYVARGSQAEIEVSVLEEQKLDSLGVVGSGIEGVGILDVSEEPIIDSAKGIKIYKAVLDVTLLSQATNDTFYIQAQVSRELNGSPEIKTAQATVILVDFKLDSDRISIEGAHSNNLTVWLGVPKPLQVNYKLLPESYNYPTSDLESAEKAEQIKKEKQDFINNQCYPASVEGYQGSYYINYKNQGSTYNKVSLYQRLFFVNGNTRVPVSDESETRAVRFVEDENTGTVSITGIALNQSARILLETYISAGGVTKVCETYFTVYVQAFSDPDVPLLISNASDFLALDPSNYSNQNEITRNDYILENDIVLENYTGFNTNAIRSLDGNGFTIFIKSYNVEVENTQTLNLALFNTIQKDTTIKNLRVNLYNGGQLTIDRFTYKNINLAGLAIRNEGVIYNSEVVAFYTQANAKGVVDANTGIAKETNACVSHDQKTGINVKFVKGRNTTEEDFVTEGSDWTPRISAFVLYNSGSITNSRVGGDEITIVGADETDVNGNKTGFTSASLLELPTFYIVGQGNVSGFVLENESTGYIAASFAKNIDIENLSRKTDFYTTGFAGLNSGSIITSYVEAVDDEIEEDFGAFSNTGSSIKSSYGYIVGFVYNNNSTIKDSYSNILIANSSDNVRVYLASGFVYTNRGNLENCYSSSQIANARYTQMNFSGVNAQGDLLANGTYTNCYFFNKDYASEEDNYDNSTETQYSTGALIISNPKLLSSFYGFAIASSTDSSIDGIWRINETNGVTLVGTNLIAISHRYTYYVPKDKEDNFAVTNQNEKGKYVLPYSTLERNSMLINTALGSSTNPILIANAQDFVDISGNSASTYVQQYFNNNEIFGAYRIINNIDLSVLKTSETSVVLPSSSKNFGGTLQGNGFKISGISINSDSTDVAYGLFKSISPHNETDENGKTIGRTTPQIKNVDFEVERVGAGATVMVGAIAGFIKDSKIINIDVTFKENAYVTGTNFVGGIAGLLFGDNYIKNVVVKNPNVRSTNNLTNDDGFFSKSKLVAFRNNVFSSLSHTTQFSSSIIQSITNTYSFAGGVFGFADNYTSFSSNPTFGSANINYTIDNIRVNGNVSIEGAVAGGLFGFTGNHTNVIDAGITISGTTNANTSKIIATKYFAGGIIGQSFGALTRSFSRYDETTQRAIEENIARFYSGDTNVERGAIDIFYSEDGQYSKKYVGGLIGCANSGFITISYSKLNVISQTADYVGGIVGAIDVADENINTYTPCDFDGKPIQGANTKYYMSEVYATGDVRGKLMAGGLIGAIKGEGSMVALRSVNALNYISNYDYFNNEYVAITQGQSNLSANFKVNSLVGQFIKYVKDEESENIIEVLQDINSTNIGEYQKYIKFVQYTIATNDTSSDILQTGAPSVAYYESYSFANNETTLNMFGSLDGKIENNYFFTDTNNLIYAIASAKNYTSSSVGHTYTQVGFIGSTVWESKNWMHSLTELFPSIRNTQVVDVVYLDQYKESIINVRNAISGNSNVKVIIRGLTSQNGDAYGDIELTEELCEEFRGILVGGIYKTGNNDDADFVKIIAKNAQVFGSVEGATIRNVTVEFTTSNNNDERIEMACSGMFANSIQNSNVTNLKLNFRKMVSITVSDDNNVGLLAGRIQSSNISNLEINTEIGEDNSLLTIQGNGITLNAGLVAGSVEQDSTITTLQINNINLNIGDAISIDNTKFENYNVGAYFGEVIREHRNTQEVRININDLINKKETDVIKYTYITLNDIGENANLNVGGYIGRVKNVSSLSTYKNEIAVHVRTRILSNNINTLNHGLIIGKVESSYTFNFDGRQSKLYGGLYTSNNVTINNLNAGGIYGRIGDDENILIPSFANVKVSNLQSVNYEIAGGVEDRGSNLAVRLADKYNNLTGNYFTVGENKEATNAMNVGNANLGVLVGSTNSPFEVIGNNTKLNNRTDNTFATPESVPNSFRVNSTGELNIGSVVGYSTNNNGQDNNAESGVGNNDSSTLEISGNILSELDIYVNGSSSTNVVGGMVGKVSGASANVKLNENTRDNYLEYNGALFSNSKNLTFGGMIGQIVQTSGNGSSCIEVGNNRYGGVVKIFGESSNDGNIITGGVIGELNYNNNTSIIIKNSYLYGDVFVEYGTGVNSLVSYNFAGLIAKASGTSESYKEIYASQNYSLFTTHNARLEDSDNVRALFGAGVCNVSVSASESHKNYYNHSVVLAKDDNENAIDRGYDRSYTTNIIGYGHTDAGNYLLYSFSFAKDMASGHKLNPLRDLNSVGNKFNGMTYYVVPSNLTNGKSVKINNSSNFENIAFIGDTLEKSYSFEENNEEKDFFAPINKLSGYSYISSLLLNIDIKIEKGENTQVYAGLVSEMEGNSIVFASQVKGKIEVGSYIEVEEEITSNGVEISGLVGTLSSGRISDCSTDIDILYRAGKDGTMYGITKLENEEGNSSYNKIIENTYSAGSLKSYLPANMYAFTNGVAYAKINNSYTITRLDWNDYTSETPNSSSSIFSAFGENIENYGIEKCYYDTNTLVKTLTKNIGTEGIPVALNNSPWKAGKITSDEENSIIDKYDFNYGYPVLDYGYLRVSSYATIRNRVDEIKTESYDKYVETYNYTRLANNTIPTGTNDYLMILNKQMFIDVLTAKKVTTTLTEGTENSITTLTLDGNYILMSDFDGSGLGTNQIIFKGIIDGQKHTIKGLNASLFKEIQGTTEEGKTTNAVIRNLRLTDVTGSNAVLADKIDNAIISNMTLSGNIAKTDVTGQVGAIANTITNSEINTVTNLIKLDVTASGSVDVGGFAGHMTNSSILYSSNYGNINVNLKEENGNVDDKDVSVGGLVGAVIDGEESEISHSYNTGSVLAGYTSSYIGNYKAGGIVGYSTVSLEIKDSYNSGIIKAGNKSNGKEVIREIVDNEMDDVTYFFRAFAGGIIAYGENVIISNSFNEGNIEALGKNPETAFRWKNLNGISSNGATNGVLELYQTSERNVWAYGIGWFEGENNLVSAQNMNDDDKNIYMNGSSKNEDAEINTWKDISNKLNISNELYSQVIDHHFWLTNWYMVYLPIITVITPVGIAVPNNNDYDSHNEISYEIKKYIPSEENKDLSNTGDKPEVVIKSYDNLGIPNSFDVLTKTIINYKYRVGAMVKYLGMGDSQTHWEDYKTGSIVNYEYAEINFSKDEDNSFDKYNKKDAVKYATNINIESGASIDKESIRKSTRSAKEFSNIEEIIVNIGGKKYYLVDKNNASSLFNAGMYFGEIKGKISYNLPYIPNTSMYSISNLTITKNGETETRNDIYASITKVYKIGEETAFDIFVSSEREIEGDLNFTITCGYEENIKVDTSDLNYIFTDYNSVGIDMKNIGFSDNYFNRVIANSGNHALSKGDSKYNIVIKAYLADVDEQIVEENLDDYPDDYDKYIYFGYNDESQMLVYIPNAELRLKDNDEAIEVNKNITGFDGTEEKFKDNIKLIIEKLKEKTLYFRTKTTETQTVSVSFNNDSVMSNYAEIHKNEHYGKVESGNFEYGNETILTPSNITKNASWTYNGSFDIIFKNISTGENGSYVLDLNSVLGNNTSAEYSYENSVWTVNNGSGNVSLAEIENLNYSITGGNELTLTLTDVNVSNRNLDDLKNAILGEFNSLTINDENATSYISKEITSNVNISNANHTFVFDLNFPDDEFIVMKGNDPVLSYKKTTTTIGEGEDAKVEVDEKWTFKEGNSITVDDAVITIENGKFKLTTSASVEIVDINEYLSKLKFITNNFDKVVEIKSPLGSESEFIRGSIEIANQLKLDYVYVEAWNLNETTLLTGLLTNDVGSYRISLKKDNGYDALNKFELGGVSVYKGSIEYNATYTYRLRFTRVEFKDSCDITDGTVYDLTVNGDLFVENIVKNDISITYPTTALREPAFDMENGKINIVMKAYPTYKMDVDDMGNFSVIAAINDQVAQICGTIKEDIIKVKDDSTNQEQEVLIKIIDNSSSNVNYIVEIDGEKIMLNYKYNYVSESLFYKVDNIYYNVTTEDVDENNIKYYYEKISGYDENANPITERIEIEGEYINNIIKGNSKHTLSYNNKDFISYTEVNGEIISYTKYNHINLVEGLPTTENVVTIDEFTEKNVKFIITNKDGEKAVSLPFDKIFNNGKFNIEYNSYKDMIKYRVIENEEYLTIDSDNVYNSYEFISNSKTINQIERQLYAWKDNKTLPEFNTVLKSPLFELDMSKITIKVDDKDYSLGEQYFIEDGGKVEFILKKNKGSTNNTQNQITDEILLTINIKEEDATDNIKQEGVTYNTMIEPYDIILTGDISLKDATQFTKNQDINIVGNDYYISFHGEGLYNQINVNDNYIRNVMLLGEVENSSFVTNKLTKETNSLAKETNSIRFKDITLYGSIINNEAKKSMIFSDKGNDIQIGISDVKSYVNTVGIGKNDIILFGDIATARNVKNFGTIVARDGDYGSLSINVYLSSNGENGKSIQAFSSKIEENGEETFVTNNGVLKTGRGGNAGAGKDYKHEADSETTTKIDRISGKAGNVGKHGDISGFTDDGIKVVNDNPKKATKGVIGRAPYGKISKGTEGRSDVWYLNKPSNRDPFEYTKLKEDGNWETVKLGGTFRNDGDIWDIRYVVNNWNSTIDQMMKDVFGRDITYYFINDKGEEISNDIESK